MIRSGKPPFEILLYNRQTGALEKERVYGRKWMDLFYGTPTGRRITNLLLCRRPLSRIYGWLQTRPRSRTKIQAFVKQYRINLAQAVVPPEGFASFNDFFIRRLQPGARPFSEDPSDFISPADSRLQVYPIRQGFSLEVKGLRMTLPRLLGQSKMENRHQGGLCLCFRLAPCDYHRFGYPSRGVQGRVHSVGGLFHSVSPLAMRHKPDVLASNFRQWCLVQTELWGTLIQVEVGAMMVGSIVQHNPAGCRCQRAEEKGYFQFGGSTVLVIVEPGRLRVDDDILAQSERGIETLVRYGETVGKALGNPND